MSCCNTNDVMQIRTSVLKLMRKECKSCFSMVAEWKCAECDPDAGKININTKNQTSAKF